MNVALWVVQGVLAVIMLMAGTVKLRKSRDELVGDMAWVEGVSDGTVRLIGALETLGALGLILPGVTGIAPVLVPIAAAGLAIIQALALAVHTRRKEFGYYPMNIAFIAAGAFIAWGRFGDYAL